MYDQKPLTVESYKLVNKFPEVMVSAQLREGVLSIKMSPESTARPNTYRPTVADEIYSKKLADIYRIQDEMILRALDHFGDSVKLVQQFVRRGNHSNLVDELNSADFHFFMNSSEYFEKHTAFLIERAKKI